MREDHHSVLDKIRYDMHNNKIDAPGKNAGTTYPYKNTFNTLKKLSKFTLYRQFIRGGLHFVTKLIDPPSLIHLHILSNLERTIFIRVILLSNLHDWSIPVPLICHEHDEKNNMREMCTYL